MTIEDVFAFLADIGLVGLLADMKGAGWEEELVEALRRHDLVERTVASTSNCRGPAYGVSSPLGRSRTYPRGRLFLAGRRTSIRVRPCPRPCASSCTVATSMKSGPRR